MANRRRGYRGKPKVYRPPEPTEVEKVLLARANRMSPTELKRAIQDFQAKAKKTPSITLNVCIMVFKGVFQTRLDCGPEYREIRVSATS